MRVPRAWLQRAPEPDIRHRVVHCWRQALPQAWPGAGRIHARPFHTVWNCARRRAWRRRCSGPARDGAFRRRHPACRPPLLESGL